MIGSKDAGFSASYYTSASGNVISYRGTDSQSLLNSDTSGGPDITNGWLLGGGMSAASQAAFAVQFYNNVTNTSPYAGQNQQDLTLTGHSLGGGLASFVSTLSGTRSVIFDNMPGTIAAIQAMARQAVCWEWRTLRLRSGW